MIGSTPKLYLIFQDLSRRSIEIVFGGIETLLKFIKCGLRIVKPQYNKSSFYHQRDCKRNYRKYRHPRAAVVHLNFRAGSSFPVLVCTVSPGHWVNKADTQ